MTQHAVNRSEWTDEKIRIAKQIWADYQATHDVSNRKGEAAGIDPETGDVWLGKDIIDIADQQKAKGPSSPLFFMRIGYPTYYRKGGRRRSGCQSAIASFGRSSIRDSMDSSNFLRI